MDRKYIEIVKDNDRSFFIPETEILGIKLKNNNDLVVCIYHINERKWYSAKPDLLTLIQIINSNKYKEPQSEERGDEG